MTLASKYARPDIAPAELRSTTRPAERASTGDRRATPPPGDAAFVLTLCSMAAPISLPQPRSPQLTRFTFFFSRERRTGGQYQLHMGYFATIEEAQKWHKILAGIYPDAYVAEAPGGEPDLLSDSQVLRILQDARSNQG